MLRNTQTLLMRNYQNVLRVIAGREPTETIRIVYGVAAFLSLHVAFQTYVFLWMRRLWRGGEVLFGVFVAIFLGSIITGWHYLIDGLARDPPGVGLLRAVLAGFADEALIALNDSNR